MSLFLTSIGPRSLIIHRRSLPAWPYSPLCATLCSSVLGLPLFQRRNSSSLLPPGRDFVWRVNLSWVPPLWSIFRSASSSIENDEQGNARRPLAEPGKPLHACRFIERPSASRGNHSGNHRSRSRRELPWDRFGPNRQVLALFPEEPVQHFQETSLLTPARRGQRQPLDWPKAT